MVSYRQPYIHSLNESELRVELYNGGPPLTGLDYREQPQQYRTFQMTANRTPEMPLCWYHSNRDYDNARAAELIIKFWLEYQPTGHQRP